MALSVSAAGLAASLPTLKLATPAPAGATAPRPDGLTFPPFKASGSGSGSYRWVGGFARPGALPDGTSGSLSVQSFQLSTGAAAVTDVSGGGDRFVAAPGDAALLVAPGRIGSAFGGARGGGATASGGGDSGTTANGAGGGEAPTVAAATTGGALEGAPFVVDATATPTGDGTGADTGGGGGFGVPGGGFGVPGSGGSNSGGTGGSSSSGNSRGNLLTGGGDDSGIRPDLVNHLIVPDFRPSDSPDVLISSVLNTVPEAPSLALLGPGLLGLAFIRRPRRRG